METSEAESASATEPRAAPPEIEHLLARAMPVAEAVARRNGASRARAAEIAQSVLIDIWQEWRANPEAFNASRPLAALVAPRVRGTMINHHVASDRRIRRDGMFLSLHHALVSEGQHPDEGAVTHVLWQLVGRALADAPKASREVFLLVEHDNATYDQVARARGITPATARVHYHKAIVSLRAALGHNPALLT
jgi:RNA polymerase sigma factor (sigma-70 family)